MKYRFYLSFAVLIFITLAFSVLSVQASDSEEKESNGSPLVKSKRCQFPQDISDTSDTSDTEEIIIINTDSKTSSSLNPNEEKSKDQFLVRSHEYKFIPEILSTDSDQAQTQSTQVQSEPEKNQNDRKKDFKKKKSPLKRIKSFFSNSF